MEYIHHPDKCTICLWLMLCSLWWEIAFFRGTDCVPRHPAAGYDPGRCNAGAWKSAAGWCRAFFRQNFRFALPLFCGMAKQIFCRISHIWGIAVFCLRKTLYPKPLYFFLKNNFIISPQRKHNILKKWNPLCCQKQKKNCRILVCNSSFFIWFCTKHRVIFIIFL